MDKQEEGVFRLALVEALKKTHEDLGRMSNASVDGKYGNERSMLIWKGGKLQELQKRLGSVLQSVNADTSVYDVPLEYLVHAKVGTALRERGIDHLHRFAETPLDELAEVFEAVDVEMGVELHLLHHNLNRFEMFPAWRQTVATQFVRV